MRASIAPSRCAVQFRVVTAHGARGSATVTEVLWNPRSASMPAGSARWWSREGIAHQAVGHRHDVARCLPSPARRGVSRAAPARTWNASQVSPFGGTTPSSRKCGITSCDTPLQSPKSRSRSRESTLERGAGRTVHGVRGHCAPSCSRSPGSGRRLRRRSVRRGPRPARIPRSFRGVSGDWIHARGVAVRLAVANDEDGQGRYSGRCPRMRGGSREERRRLPNVIPKREPEREPEQGPGKRPAPGLSAHLRWVSPCPRPSCAGS